MGLPKYEYQALTEPGTFRLLRFGACNFDSKLSITISLETFKIEDAPPYQAFSYCWGKKKAKKQIVCNGKALHVTSTLVEALRHLYPRIDDTSSSTRTLDGSSALERSIFPEVSYPQCSISSEHSVSLGSLALDSSYATETPPSYLWIDQICINQTDTLERNHQVGSMRNIYRGAIRTVIWLGPDSGFASQAFDLVRDIFAVVEQESPNHVDIAWFEREAFDADLHDKRGLPVHSDRRWHALDVLLNSPWFERLWVVQEVVLSQQDAYVVCGYETCSWYVLSTACTWLMWRSYYSAGYCRAGTVFRASQMRYTSMAHDSMNLADLVYATSTAFCVSDPRDMIFGLLGLMSQSDIDAMVADYTLSPMQVYRDFVWDMVCRQGSLALLNMPPCRNKQIRDPFRRIGRQAWWKGTPSWVPNIEAHGPFDLHFMTVCTERKGLCWRRQYNAARGVSYQHYDNPDRTGYVERSTLLLKGLVVGTVDCCFEVNTERSTLWQMEEQKQQTRFGKWDWTEWRKIALASYSLLSAMRLPIGLSMWTKLLEYWPTRDVSSVARSICRTMALDRSATAEQLEEPDFNDFCAFMIDIHSRWRTRFKCMGRRFHTNFEVLRRHAEGGVGRRYLDLTIMRCHLKRCFITQDGQPGVGSSSMRKGDTIVVLFGGGTPYILRRRKSQWLFIGDCYVDGLMKGQAIDKWRAGELQEQCFEII